MVLAPFEDLAEDRLADLKRYMLEAEWKVKSGGIATYVHDGDGLLAWVAQILDHVLDEHRALGDTALYKEDSVCAQGKMATLTYRRE